MQISISQFQILRRYLRELAHADVEQANYILEGRARVEVAGQVQVLGPGDMCYFPKNTDHAVTRISEEPLKVLVIYAPPKD